MKTQELQRVLSSLPLFATTAPEAIAHWLARHAPPICSLQSGERADRPGVRELGILLEGDAEIQSLDSERSVILRKISAPTVFGAATLFCTDDKPLSRILVKDAAKVLYLSAHAVNDLFDSDVSFREAYLTFLSDRVGFLNKKIRCFTAGSAVRRLALWLVSEESDRITLNASIATLGDMLSISRASLYRAFDQLEQEGLIRRNGREILLPSPNAILERYQ